MNQQLASVNHFRCDFSRKKAFLKAVAIFTVAECRMPRISHPHLLNNLPKATVVESESLWGGGLRSPYVVWGVGGAVGSYQQMGIQYILLLIT